MSKYARPELLAPAGSIHHVRAALSYGADAVYAGIPRWSLRVRGNGFTREDFKTGIELAHSMGKKFFAVLNVIPHARRLSTFEEDLDSVAALKPDAFIMADPGLIDLALTRHPEIPVHLSVQANTVNPLSVKFWQKLGVRRCILARELSLSEIGIIREACPDMELEVFIHGALCIAVSGRCLISGLLSRRDANVGNCNNSCRWRFRARSLSVELEECEKRQGEWFTLDEDENGSYLFNSRDLCALPLLEKLLALNIDSLKIEGRSRSPFYGAAVSRAYRLAIDALLKGEPVPLESGRLLNALPSRKFTTGLLEPHLPHETQDYASNSPHKGRFELCAAPEAIDGGRLRLRVKNRFDVKSTLFIYTPKGALPLEVTDLRDENGAPAEVAPGDGYIRTVPAPEGLTLEHPGESFVVRLREEDEEDRPA